MAYDRGLVERVADALLVMGETTARQRNVFGGRGFLLGRTAFAIVWEEGLLVKVPPGEYKQLLEIAGVEPFAPGGEKPMGSWLLVHSEVIADDPELRDWLRRGLAGIARQV